MKFEYVEQRRPTRN